MIDDKLEVPPATGEVPVSVVVRYGRGTGAVSLSRGNVDGCIRAVAGTPAQCRAGLLTALARMTEAVR